MWYRCHYSHYYRAALYVKHDGKYFPSRNCRIKSSGVESSCRIANRAIEQGRGGQEVNILGQTITQKTRQIARERERERDSEEREFEMPPLSPLCSTFDSFPKTCFSFAADHMGGNAV